MPASVAVITHAESDLLALMRRCPQLSISVLSPLGLTAQALEPFSCACVLGGTSSEPLVLPASSRAAMEEFSAGGRRVFWEYTLSFHQNYCRPPESTRFLRLSCTDEAFAHIGEGTLLDDQCNQRAAPYYHNRQAHPILMYKTGLTQHAQQVLSEEDRKDFSSYGLWMERPGVAACSFRLCNFVRARFAPAEAWRQVIRSLLEWLCGQSLELSFDQAYATGQPLPLLDCANAAIRWFGASGTLLEGGSAGVWEGFGTEVDPEGVQKRAQTVRTDCAGEAALAYFLHSMATGDQSSRQRARRLEAFVYDRMQVKEGPFAGMLRWTEVAWEVCYQDDMARAMLVTLLRALYQDGREYLPSCRQALEFLMNTTGPDGLRPARTDALNMTPEGLEELRQKEGAFPCAHYNAFYLACLLLYGKMEGDQRCLEVGERGMRTLLAAYPHTVREQSETEEACRLLLPAAWLYFATGKEEDRAMLHRLVEDMERFRHPSGAYLEWDSDYSAACSKTEGGECSLLAQNGDPVVDLLYSNNWVPLGLMQAYFVTGEERFYQLFEANAQFLRSAQIHSEDPHIHGAWARGYDVERGEVFGLPNDIGWGPWAIESGWTVAEIAAGLLSGVMKDRLMGYYRENSGSPAPLPAGDEKELPGKFQGAHREV